MRPRCRVVGGIGSRARPQKILDASLTTPIIEGAFSQFRQFFGPGSVRLAARSLWAGVSRRFQ
jgi:hypothetical protein